MAKVDFYVLERGDEQARLVLACRIAEKAWRLKNTIHIHTTGNDVAERMDQLLWTFRDGSFVPHARAGNEGDQPISIDSGDTLHSNASDKDLLISLCDDVPPFTDSFARVAEIITPEEHSRSQGRTRFAWYREQGHDMETHKI